MMTRRTVLQLISSIVVTANALPRLAFADDEPRFTAPPPGDETAEIKSLIDDAAAELTSDATRVSELLCSARYMPAHEWPRFRRLIQQHAPPGVITICTTPEPGDPIEVTCKVVDERGNGAPGALVYLYHTSAKGWYSDRAPHYSGISGDVKHARLFGYVRTDDTGTFKLRTRRPGGYPRSDLPQHIHIDVTSPNETLLSRVSEVLFEDDDRLRPAHALERAKREHFIIGDVERAPDGVQYVRVRFELARKK